MQSADLIEVLNEYPMSLRLVLKAKGHHMSDTTVIEVQIKLMEMPPDESITFFGLSSVIFRDRTEEKHGHEKRWLEMDAR